MVPSRAIPASDGLAPRFRLLATLSARTMAVMLLVLSPLCAGRALAQRLRAAAGDSVPAVEASALTPTATADDTDRGASLFAPVTNGGADLPPAAQGAFALPGENLILGLRWDHGLRYELGDRRLLALRRELQPGQTVSALRGKIGLKLQLDAAAYETSGSLPAVESDAGIRLLRLYTSGSFFLLRPAAYKLEMEFNQQSQTHYLREAWLEFSLIPGVQRLKVGHFRAPFSLEGYAGGSDTTFVSLAGPTEAFQPGIRFGVQEGGATAAERATWALGVFANGDDPDVTESSKSGANVIGRVTHLPLLEQNAGQARLLHLGLGIQYLAACGNSLRYRTRPESYFAPRLVDTQALAAETAVQLAGEAAYVHGPGSVQGELFGAAVPDAAGEQLWFWGGYLQGSWALTGETRPYDREAGVFRRLVPARPFTGTGGNLGAWEVAARLSCVDLTDRAIAGGQQVMVTLGLNVYLTAHWRIMFNAGRGRVSERAENGDITVFQTRLQMDF